MSRTSLLLNLPQELQDQIYRSVFDQVTVHLEHNAKDDTLHYHLCTAQPSRLPPHDHDLGVGGFNLVITEHIGAGLGCAPPSASKIPYALAILNTSKRLRALALPSFVSTATFTVRSVAALSMLFNSQPMQDITSPTLQLPSIYASPTSPPPTSLNLLPPGYHPAHIDLTLAIYHTIFPTCLCPSQKPDPPSYKYITPLRQHLLLSLRALSPTHLATLSRLRIFITRSASRLSYRPTTEFAPALGLGPRERLPEPGHLPPPPDTDEGRELEANHDAQLEKADAEVRAMGWGWGRGIGEGLVLVPRQIRRYNDEQAAGRRRAGIMDPRELAGGMPLGLRQVGWAARRGLAAQWAVGVRDEADVLLWKWADREGREAHVRYKKEVHERFKREGFVRYSRERLIALVQEAVGIADASGVLGEGAVGNGLMSRVEQMEALVELVCQVLETEELTAVACAHGREVYYSQYGYGTILGR